MPRDTQVELDAAVPGLSDHDSAPHGDADSTGAPPWDTLHDQAQQLSSHEALYDTLFSRIRAALVSDPETETDEQRQRMSLREEHGLLWHSDTRLYVPNRDQLRLDVLYWHHDVPWKAHMGIKRTVRMTTQQFFWPNMQADITNYVDSCTSCQSNKTDRRRKVPALSPLVPPSSCWRTIGVDLITDLPKSETGHNALCVFVCHLSKMVRLIPTVTTLSAPGFAKLFFSQVFPHYGFPLNLVSDGGPQWNSEFWKSLCQRAGVALLLSTAFHAQTNGQTERTNEVVECATGHYTSADMSDWDDLLPLVEFAMNSAHHEAIKSTPFKMNRITFPANPFDVLLHHHAESPLNQRAGSEFLPFVMVSAPTSALTKKSSALAAVLSAPSRS